MNQLKALATTLGVTPPEPQRAWSPTPTPDDDAADIESEHEAATHIVVPQELRLKWLSDGSDSALAHTSPYLDHRRVRSGSNPEMYTCPWSVNVSADASDTLPPKSATLSQSQQVQHASSSREGDPSFSTRSPLVRNPDGGDMSASHFPLSFTNRETSSGRVSPLPPHSDSSNTIETPLPSSSSSDTAVPLPQMTGAGKKSLAGTLPSFNFTPRRGVSTASTEAKKLEEERSRKMRDSEEKQNPRPEKSAANDMDREGHMSKQPSTSTSTTQLSNTTIQPGSNHTGKFECYA